MQVPDHWKPRQCIFMLHAETENWYPSGIGLGITNRTIIWKDIANASTISVYNPVVNMIPWKEIYIYGK